MDNIRDVLACDSKNKFKNVKLIVSNVDGVITDGCHIYDELSNVPWKKYNLTDFEAINELKKTFNFVFISSHNEVNYNLMRKKNIPFYWANKSKKQVLLKIIERYNVTAEEVLYIGASYSDIPCINYIPYSFCPSDAPNSVKSAAVCVLKVKKGCGVISYLYEELLDQVNRRKACL